MCVASAAVGEPECQPTALFTPTTTMFPSVTTSKKGNQRFFMSISFSGFRPLRSASAPKAFPLYLGPGHRLSRACVAWIVRSVVLRVERVIPPAFEKRERNIAGSCEFTRAEYRPVRRTQDGSLSR